MPARWIGQARVHLGAGHESGQKHGNGAADGVNAEGVERVVKAEHRLQFNHGQIGENAANDAKDHRIGGGDVAAGRGDDDQAADCPGTETEHARFARLDPLGEGPDGGADRGGNGGDHEGVRGDAVRAERAAGIEAIPADPEHGGACHAEHHRVRRHLFLPVTLALAQHDAEHERGPAAGHVNDHATGKIDGFDGGGAVANAVDAAPSEPQTMCVTGI